MHARLTLILLLFAIFSFAEPFHVKLDSGKESLLSTVPGEIIVKLKPGFASSSLQGVLKRNNSSLIYTSRFGNFQRVKVQLDKDYDEVLRNLKNEPEILYAEPNYIAHAHWVPNDLLFNYQWNFSNIKGSSINATKAWDIQKGTDAAIVAIIDCGIAYENFGPYAQAPDLASVKFISGYDFVNRDNHPNDDNGHGTHVCGTIAQSTNNNYGCAGIAFGVKIMPLKVLDASGSGSYASIAEAIRYAVDHNAKVINMSLGGPVTSRTLQDAIIYAADKNVVLIASAGNDGDKGVISYPAAYEQCIAVAATRYDGMRAGYSSSGSYIDVAAPGGDLNVDQNNDGYVDGIVQQTIGSNPKNFGFYFYQGTSMAAPHVSAIAALLVSKGITGAKDIREAIEKTTHDLGSVGFDNFYGWGLVDANAALNYRFTKANDVAIERIGNVPWVFQGEVVPETVFVANEGTSQQTIDITISDSILSDPSHTTHVIGTTTLTVPPLTSSYVMIPWNTATETFGNHVIKACASIANDQDTTDNCKYGQIAIRTMVHDVAITGMKPNLDSVLLSSACTVSVTIENRGTYTETQLKVSLTDSTGKQLVSSQVFEIISPDSIIIANIPISLQSGAQGIYKVQSSIEPVNEELDTLNNHGWTYLSICQAIYSSSMNMGLLSRKSGKNTLTRSVDTITVISDNGVPVPGVSLTGSWSTTTNDTDTATTDSKGVAIIYSDELANVKTGSAFTFSIKNLVKTGFIYNPTSPSAVINKTVVK